MAAISVQPRFFLQKVFASAADLFISPPTTPTGFAPTAALGNRLTVDPRTLTPLVLVRIQVPQPIFSLQFLDFQIALDVDLTPLAARYGAEIPAHRKLRHL